jgi:hypothetical protein
VIVLLRFSASNLDRFIIMGPGDQSAVANSVAVGCILRLKEFKPGGNEQPKCDNPDCKTSSEHMRYYELDGQSYGHPIVVLQIHPGQEEGGKSEVKITFAKVGDSILHYLPND